MAPGPQTMIKSVQPYRKVADPEQHPLWKLHVLNVGDKHRRPHLVGAVLQGTKVDVLEYEDVDIELFLSSFRFWIGPFKNGATVQTATLKATGENPMVNFEADTVPAAEGLLPTRPVPCPACRA